MRFSIRMSRHAVAPSRTMEDKIVWRLYKRIPASVRLVTSSQTAKEPVRTNNVAMKDTKDLLLSWSYAEKICLEGRNHVAIRP